MNKKFIIGIVIFIVAFVGVITFLPERSTYDLLKPISLEDYDGNVVTTESMKGKVLVINSWTTWCPFCVEELDDFAELQKAFPEDVVVVAINRGESLNTAKSFTDSLGVSDEYIFLLDPKDSFYTTIGGFSMPETLFVNGEGGIQIHKRGAMTFEEMKEKVESIINN